jgi:DNA topoisomerase IB
LYKPAASHGQAKRAAVSTLAHEQPSSHELRARRRAPARLGTKPARMTTVSRQPDRSGSDKEREFRAAARSARLRYVSDYGRGFTRRLQGKSFKYLRPDGKTLRHRATLARIRLLAIPPAWHDVWICPAPNGHLQATGRDARGRKQYRYHPRCRQAQDRRKYERIVAFAKALPKIRRTVARHLRKRGLPRDKVLAATVKLLETTAHDGLATRIARDRRKADDRRRSICPPDGCAPQ